MADDSADNAQGSYPLHESVFHDDLERLSSLLSERKVDIAQPDPHGNTALHLAAMLGRKEMVDLLLSHGAPIKNKNKQGWNVMHESISFGDRDIISTLLAQFSDQLEAELKSQKPNLIAGLKKLDDCQLELRWDFTSWLPLVSKMLPSDVCKIYKRGSSLRLDTSVFGFSHGGTERGNVSLICKGDEEDKDMFVHLLDHDTQMYKGIRTTEFKRVEKQDEEINALMSTELFSTELSTANVTYTRSTNGWLFKSERDQETIGKYNAIFYDLKGIVLETRKRQEHLNSDDMKKNQALWNSMKNGTLDPAAAADLEKFPQRSSLPPPPGPLPAVSWSSYIKAKPSQAAFVGRKQVCKESFKAFKATVAMSEEFPITLDMLYSVLEGQTCQNVEAKVDDDRQRHLTWSMTPAVVAMLAVT